MLNEIIQDDKSNEILIKIDDIVNIDFSNWKFEDISIPKSNVVADILKTFFIIHNKNLWKFLMLFRILAILEMMINNNNLKFLTFEELKLFSKLK